jgi:TPR repeat protein
MYKNGDGVERDDARAVEWLRRAAEQRLAFAQNHLGSDVLPGPGRAPVGLPRRRTGSRSRPSRAIRRPSRTWATCCATGAGVARNPEQALAGTSGRRAGAAQRPARLLGECYLRGEGAAVNHALAMAWLRKAALGKMRRPSALGLMVRRGLGMCAERAEAPTGSGARPGAAMRRRSGCWDCATWKAWACRATPRRRCLAALRGRAGRCRSPVQPGPAAGQRARRAPRRGRRRSAGPRTTRAAKQGHVLAQYNLGNMYAHGRGVAGRSVRQALYWYRRAAEQGAANAQFTLGVMYANGQGVHRDEALAVEWYRRAAGAGRCQRPEQPGRHVRDRPGRAAGRRAGGVLVRLAAEQGHALAQYNLGGMYNSGRGVARDSVRSYMWMLLAADAGDPAASANKAIVARRLSQEQIASADEMRRQWQNARSYAGPERRAA